MSEKLWVEVLHQRMACLHSAGSHPRIAVVGIGHELRGDDAAGVVLARRLKQACDGFGLLVIEAGPAPEKCCGLLLDYHPDLVLFIDAAEMGTEPGVIHLLGWNTIEMTSGVLPNWSTHGLPLPELADFLAVELDCPIWLLGIQPAQTTMSESLSAPVYQAVATGAQILADLFSVSQGVSGT